MTSNLVIGLSDADAAVLAELVHEAQAAQAEIEAAQARMARTLAAAQKLAAAQQENARAQVRNRDMALRGIAAELAAATRSTDRSVQRRIGDAVTLVDDFPATLAAWESGSILHAHVRLIVEVGLSLPPEARAEFERAALPRCERELPGRLRGELAILAERMHPRTLTERHAEALATRSVTTFPLRNGMSGLLYTGPSLHVEAIHDRLTQQATVLVDARMKARERLRARRAEAPDATVADDDPDEILASDQRTMDELRADLLADMLLTSVPGANPVLPDDGPGTLGAIRARVQVIVPALTLLGSDEHPADLNGVVPIDADTARTLAGGVPDRLLRVLTDPVTGSVLATDARFADGALGRFLRARDRHCRWPGCRVPALRCQIDHTIDHARGGPTSVENCEGLCQRHHSMKHATPWKVRQLGGGVLEWTSPLGRTYIDDPPAPTVHFVPEVPDPVPVGAAPF